MACVFCALQVTAQDHDDHQHDAEVDVIATAKVKDAKTQQAIHSSSAWQSFEKNHGSWYAEFNPITGLPLRTFGSPISHPVQQGNYELAARDFMRTKISSLNLSEENFRLVSVETRDKYAYVNFKQYHNAIPVMHSEYTVRFYDDKTVPLFGVSAYDMSNAPASESLTLQAGELEARAGLTGTIESVEIGDQFYVPVESKNVYSMKLAREYTVRGQGTELPFVFKTYVDMSNGNILFRRNLVCTFEANKANTPPMVDFTFNGDLISSFLNPAVNTPFPEMEVVIPGTGTFITDAQGKITGVNITTPTQAEVRMKGNKASVFQELVAGSPVQTVQTITLNPGQTTIDLTSLFDPAEIAGYQHTTTIHNDAISRTNNSPHFIVAPLTVNVNLPQTCNAFYNGQSINMFQAGGGCANTALVHDVIYHEFGHHINNQFPGSGAGMNNGAVNEGYADVWAFQRTEDPVLGRGFRVDPTSFVRRYDAAPKRYPENVAGQVHNDGEIIAGAWWDTYKNLGDDMNKMMQLFVGASAGYSEPQDYGELLQGVLIEALFADDDDGMLNNGTPNDNAILAAFARHGISLLTGVVVGHNEKDLVDDQTGIKIDAVVGSNSAAILQYLGKLKLNYSINNAAYQTADMTSVTAANFTYTIPGQPEGTLIHYYFTTEDALGYDGSSTPGSVNEPLAKNRNLPFSMLVGFVKKLDEDLDTQIGNWDVNVDNTDDATTGRWTFGSPLGTDNNGIPVQTGLDHSPNSNTNICFFTGQGTDPNQPGEEDVDRGKTTLYSPTLDLTTYQVPAIDYWRWFSNAAGANPQQDFLHVQITNDLNTWVDLEFTNANANVWRKKTFKVADYVAPTATVRIRWIASDSVKVGVGNNDGQSLVEVGVDDLKVYDIPVNTSTNNLAFKNDLALFPNPANDHVLINLPYHGDSDVRVKIYDAIGSLIADESHLYQTQLKINTNTLSQGLYSFTVESPNYQGKGKVMIVR